MREIKFRAWDREAERMFYSDYPIDLNFFEFLNGEMRAWRVVESPGTVHEPPYPTSEELDNIMQYTGLKDKNGKEIYEKDYLRATHPDVEFNHLGYVQYNPESAAFELYRDVYISMPLLEYDDLEIIGNIYENPELLRGGKKK